MNRQRLILPAVALIVGAGGALAVAATALPSGDTSAPAPAVQTLNAPDAPAPLVTTDTPAATPAPLNTDTPIAVPATPEPVQTLNTPTAPITANPLPAPMNAGLPPQTIQCAPWMLPGWVGPDGQATTCLWAMPNNGSTLELPPCPQEDSDNCYWDATMRGNGQGTSFINIRGHIFQEVTQ